MTRPLRRLAAGAAIAALLAASGCSTGNGDAGGNGEEVREPDRVTFLTGFGTFGREAYAYVALEKGYFAEEGIEVDIQPGGGTIPNITQTVEGDVDFALADFTGVLLAYANQEVPLDFTVVAGVLQQTVFSIIALAESGITTPRDLEGKTIADAPGSFGPLLFPAYADLAGIDVDLVEIDNSHAPPQLPALLAGGTVDGIGQFLLGKPTIEAAAEGREAVVLPFSDVLRDLYGISLITKSSLAEENPDLVQRFTRALLRGLEDAVADPEEAGRILELHEPAMDGAVAAQEVVLMVPYVQPPDPLAPFGTIDEDRVAQSIAILEGAGAIPPGMVPQDVVTFSLVPGHSG
jgi:NitT/TauT family transport system substrate-binding protein